MAGSILIPQIRGVTDFPDQSELGEAEDCLNIDLSEYGGRKRRGMAYLGKPTGTPAQTWEDGNVVSNPTGFWHFQAEGSGVFEIRGWWRSVGSARLRARYGISGAPVTPAYLVSADMRSDAQWQGTEFGGSFVIATDPQPDNDGATLIVFDPATSGFSLLDAVDRTVKPFHGSIVFWGIDGDDEGPYLAKPPKGTLLATHNGRLFVAGLQNEPEDAFRYSNLLDRRGWPANNIIRVKTAEGDPIVGFGSLGRLLVIFKRRSIHVASILSQYDAQVRQVVSGIGCANPATIVAVGGRLLFLGEDGVYAFDGSSEPVPLHKKIERRLRAMQGSFRYATAGFYRKRHQYWLGLPTGGFDPDNPARAAMGCDRILVYDLVRSEWAPYEFKDFAVRAFDSHVHYSGEEYFSGAGYFTTATSVSARAYFMRFDALDHDANPDGDQGFTGRWKSCPLHLSDHSPKRFTVLRPTFQQQFGKTLRVWWEMDGEGRSVAEDNEQFADIDAWGDYIPKERSVFNEAKWGAGRWSSVAPHQDRIGMRGAYGRTIAIGFETTGKADAFDVRNFAIDAAMEGRW